MFIRYFCPLDESPVGLLALEYLRSLVRIAPVRLIDPTRMIPGIPESPKWQRFAAMLQTPMEGDFVNVVCVPPERWAWQHTITATIEDKPEDDKAKTETIQGVRELWTAGVHNVIVATQVHLNVELTPLQFASWAKYTAKIFPQMTVDQFVANQTPYVSYRVAVPVKLHDLVRQAVMWNCDGTPRQEI